MRAVGALKPASAFRRPEPSPLSGVFAIGAMLLLAACSSSSPVVSSERPAAANASADAAEAKADAANASADAANASADAANERADAAEAKADAANASADAANASADAANERADAAEARLADLRESLAAAQAALAQGTGGEQRTAARAAVSETRGDLAKVRTDLAAQPAGAAKTAAEAALAAVDTALARTAEALAVTDPAAVSGPAQFTSADVQAMHTSLDEALIALDGALAALEEALNVATSALRTLLAQAQAVLSTAQVSLIPLLREELAEAEAEAAAQRARADAYDPRVSLAQALEPRAPGFVPRGGAEITRTPRDAEKPLHIRTEAVAFVAGKRLGSPGGGLVPTDELPLRAVTLRAVGPHYLEVQGDDHVRRTFFRERRPPFYDWGTDGRKVGVVTSSLRLSAAGPTLKFGGVGVIYHDNQRRFDLGANQDSWVVAGPDGKAGDAGATPGATMTAAHAADLGLASASGVLTAAQATALIGYALDTPSRFGADRKQGDPAAAAGAAMTAAHAADLELSEPGGALDAAQAAMLVGYAADNPPWEDRIRRWRSDYCWGEDLSLCADWNHDDLAIAFGAPSQSPHGEPAYYWKAQVPLTEAQRGQRLPDRMRNADGRPEELGTYELWLSNYGGLDKGANADDAGDDTHRYLEYAAYGLFMFFDNVRRTPSFSRPQAFALGYDAFRDAAGVRTTDVSTSIAATFQGHTMARELVNSGAQDEITLNRALPLRGEVTLNACIGGSGCTGDGIPATANRISGMISGLEEFRHDGEWISYLPAAGGIPMAEGAIAADGSFGGQLDHPRTAGGAPNTRQFDADISPTSFNTSRYGGNLYGPRDGLEAAGWWHMQVTAPHTPSGALIGSFGARCTEGCAPAN